jgi:uncharacterized protein (DUF302 family)/uncharacterized membrane protein YidH (DUF202 family)
MPDDSRATPRDFLTVERTFLAWIRTGLALMGLGFVLARFGIFLREFSLNQPNLSSQSYGLSLWFGTALIFLGVFVCLLSLVRYRRLLQQVQQPGALLSNPSALAITVALVLAILGVAMAIYLISVRPLAQNNASKSQETSVEETVARLQSILQAKGVKLFTIVDHSGEAASAGLKMPSTKLLLFGNPKAGTPLMLASPSTALDLPLKILIAEDAAGKVWISYNAPAYLHARHNLPPELLPNIAVIETLATQAAQ